MFAGVRFRPIGWIAGAATVAAMAATMAVVPTGSASTPEAPFATSFDAECVFAPGVLNARGSVHVVVEGSAPETVQELGRVTLPRSKIAITLPREWGEDFFNLGSRSVKGSVSNFSVDASHAEPATKNIARPEEFPGGVPLAAPIQSGETTLAIPSGERTFTAGPWTVTGSRGENVGLSVDAGSAYTELSTGHFEATGHGILLEVEGFAESGEANIGPVQLACTAPLGMTFITRPIVPAGGGTTGGGEVTEEQLNTQRRFETGLDAHCVLAPGVLNDAGTVHVGLHGSTYEALDERQSFQMRTAGGTITLPKEWGEYFFDTGSRRLVGSVPRLVVDAANATPAKLNVAHLFGFPNGLPIEAPVEDRELTIGLPSGARNDFAAGSWSVSGVGGEAVQLTLDSSAATREPEPGHFEATGEGMLFEVTGVNEAGEPVVGPLQIACTVPASVTLATLPIAGHVLTCTTTSVRALSAAVTPDVGPASGGTEVSVVGEEIENITGMSFGLESVRQFTVVFGSGLVKAITPPGNGTVGVDIGLGETRCGFSNRGEARFTYLSNAEKAEDKNWTVSGSVTPKPLRQPISLPTGSTFNGSAELDKETGSGSVKGNLTVPPFSAALKLFGVIPASLGLTVSQAGPFEGTVAKSQTASGKEVLTIPAKLSLAVTSLSLVGLKVPLACSTAGPLSLELVDTLTSEELLTKGWQFTGGTAISRFKCEGPLGGLLGSLLSVLLSGPEASYSLAIRSPGA